MAGHQEFKDPKLGMAVRIPSPPPLVDDLRTLLDDPEASIENIATLVQKDAGVTASLYKILSKPIYGLRRPPETIAQAVNLVGLRTLANLISGLSIQAAIYGETPFFPWFWERANEIAANDLTGDVGRAIFWYRNEPLPPFNYKTAEQLVSEGRAEDVLRYVESLEAGAAG